MGAQHIPVYWPDEPRACSPPGDRRPVAGPAGVALAREYRVQVPPLGGHAGGTL